MTTSYTKVSRASAWFFLLSRAASSAFDHCENSLVSIGGRSFLRSDVFRCAAASRKKNTGASAVRDDLFDLTIGRLATLSSSGGVVRNASARSLHRSQVSGRILQSPSCCVADDGGWFFLHIDLRLGSLVPWWRGESQIVVTKGSKQFPDCQCGWLSRACFFCHGPILFGGVCGARCCVMLGMRSDSYGRQLRLGSWIQSVLLDERWFLPCSAGAGTL